MPSACTWTRNTKLYSAFIKNFTVSNWWVIFQNFRITENVWSIVFISICLLSAREKTLWCPFPTEQARKVSVERLRWRFLWRRKWREEWLFPARVGIFSLWIMKLKYFSVICTLTWRVNNYISRQGKGIKRRNEKIREWDPQYHFDYQLTVQIVTSFPLEIIFSFISPQLNKNTNDSVSISVEQFSLQKDGNIEKEMKIGSRCKRNTRGTT